MENKEEIQKQIFENFSKQKTENNMDFLFFPLLLMLSSLSLSQPSYITTLPPININIYTNDIKEKGKCTCEKN